MSENKTVTFSVSPNFVVILIIFMVLFDPDGAAFGNNIVSLPSFFISVAEILGNFHWGFGILFSLGACISLITLHKTLTMPKSPFEPMVLKNTLKLSWRLVGVFALALLTIASGFLFIGVPWIVILTCMVIHNIYLRKMQANRKPYDNYRVELDDNDSEK